MRNTELSESEILQYAVSNGIIDTALLQEKIEMQKREEILKKHPYDIWKGKDDKWRTYLPDKEKGRKLVKRKDQKSVEDAVVLYYKSCEENPTLREIFNVYNDSILVNGKICDSSHLRYTQDFNMFYGIIENKKVKTITSDMLCDFIESRTAELKLTNKEFSNVKTITKGMFKRAYRNKRVDFRIEEDVLNVIDMSDKCFRKVKKADYQEVFSEEEYIKYIKFLEDNLDIWNMALLLILVTGLRVGEVVTLKREDIKCENENYYVEIKHTETRYKKDGKYIYAIKDAPKTEAGFRKVVVPNQYNWLCKQLLIRTPAETYIFVNPDKGNRFTTNSLRRRQERNCIKINTYQKSPHKSRKTYGSILLDNNIDENMVIQQMGHTDIETTEIHYHRNMKSVCRKAELLNEIPIFETKLS